MCLHGVAEGHVAVVQPAELGLGAQEADFAVPARVQVLHGAENAADVVGVDAVERVVLQMGGQVDSNQRQLAIEQEWDLFLGQLAAQKDHAEQAGLGFQAGQKRAELVGRGARQAELVPEAGGVLLRAAQHAGKEVLVAFRTVRGGEIADKADLAGGRRSRGALADGIAVFQQHAGDLFAHFLADARLAVEHKRDRGRGDPGLPCDFANGHSLVPLSCSCFYHTGKGAGCL